MTETQKIITIGEWDGEQKRVEVPTNATVQDALRIAGFSPTSTQQITSFSNADAVEPGENVIDGETYLLTSTNVSG